MEGVKAYYGRCVGVVSSTISLEIPGLMVLFEDTVARNLNIVRLIVYINVKVGINREHCMLRD
jgi:hypothetical protein